jgi:hypothetical protein
MGAHCTLEVGSDKCLAFLGDKRSLWYNAARSFHTLGDSSDPKSARLCSGVVMRTASTIMGYSSFAKLIRMAGQEDIDAT